MEEESVAILSDAAASGAVRLQQQQHHEIHNPTGFSPLPEVPQSYTPNNSNDDDDTLFSNTGEITPTPNSNKDMGGKRKKNSDNNVHRDISLFSVGSAVWALMAVELAERTAYYGTAFTLTTFCVDILRINLQTTNIIVNLLYVVSPIAAVISGALSDSSLQRRNVLAVGGCMYAVGLCLVAASGSPFMFHSFPYGPPEGHWGILMVVSGVMIFGLGYGTMKVCITPLLADTALVGLGSCCRRSNSGGGGGSGRRIIASNDSVYVDNNVAAAGDELSSKHKGRNHNNKDITTTMRGCMCGCVEGGYACRCNTPSTFLQEERIFGVRAVPSIAIVLPEDDNEDDDHINSNSTSGKKHSLLLLESQRDATSSDKNTNPDGVLVFETSDVKNTVNGEEEEDDEDTIRADEARCLLSKLFRMDYWVINFGSLIGIGATPFLRQIGPDRQPSASSSTVIHTGYFIGYWVCAAFTALAMCGFLVRMHTFASNHPGDAPSLFRAMYFSEESLEPQFSKEEATRYLNETFKPHQLLPEPDLKQRELKLTETADFFTPSLRKQRPPVP